LLRMNKWSKIPKKKKEEKKKKREEINALLRNEHAT